MLYVLQLLQEDEHHFGSVKLRESILKIEQKPREADFVVVKDVKKSEPVDYQYESNQFVIALVKYDTTLDGSKIANCLIEECRKSGAPLLYKMRKLLGTLSRKDDNNNLNLKLVADTKQTIQLFMVRTKKD